MGEKIRIEFDFSPEAAEKLRELQQRIGAKTRALTVNEALRLLDYATAKSIKGSRVVYQEPDPDNEGGWLETVLLPRPQ